MASHNSAPVQNRLLRLLPREELRRLEPHLEPMELQRRQILHEPGAPIKHAYFLNSGFASCLTVLASGSSVETANIGNEGFVGARILLGAETGPHRVMVQIPGHALRIASGDLKDACLRDSYFRRLLYRYLNALLTQVTQSVACNSVHSLEKRLARWLLMTHDRMQADQFPLTHELLAMMLGVRRASVTVAASKLQEHGYIRYTHGKITVLDRAGLEGASCECYLAVKKDYDSLIA
jgi:CRP-like cAMP-binding protein